MTDEHSYLERRFDEETTASIMAEDARVRDVHATFALRYRDRIRHVAHHAEPQRLTVMEKSPG